MAMRSEHENHPTDNGRGNSSLTPPLHSWRGGSGRTAEFTASDPQHRASGHGDCPYDARSCTRGHHAHRAGERRPDLVRHRNRRARSPRRAMQWGSLIGRGRQSGVPQRRNAVDLACPQASLPRSPSGHCGRFLQWGWTSLWRREIIAIPNPTSLTDGVPLEACLIGIPKSPGELKSFLHDNLPHFPANGVLERPADFAEPRGAEIPWPTRSGDLHRRPVGSQKARPERRYQARSGIVRARTTG